MVASRRTHGPVLDFDRRRRVGGEENGAGVAVVVVVAGARLVAERPCKSSPLSSTGSRDLLGAEDMKEGAKVMGTVARGALL
jgi:hypothetical protein